MSASYKWHIVSIFLFLLASFASCADSSSASSSSSFSSSSSYLPTLIWVTVTYDNGAVLTVQTPYTQQFSSFYTDVSSVPAGEVGIGSLSGSVGGIRSYAHVTISNAGNRLASSPMAGNLPSPQFAFARYLMPLLVVFGILMM